MERIVNVRVEKLPEGVYLATSDEVQGLVAQGRTITETLEIVRDVATGGGVRHGVDLREGVALQINEARLYCNLIRSYILSLRGA